MSIVGYWNNNHDSGLRRIVEIADDRVVRGPGWAIAVSRDPEPTRHAVEIHDHDKTLGFVDGHLFAADQRLGNSFDRNVTVDELGRLKDILWGQWAAAVCSASGHRLTLFRDPLGLGNLFYKKYSDGYAFASDARLLFQLVNEVPSFNWEFLSTWIYGLPTTSVDCGFEGVRQVAAGSRLELSHDCMKQQTFWNPFEIARDVHTQVNIQEFFDIYHRSVAAWLQKTDTAAALLSGGLDSSGVVAAASSSGATINAAHWRDSKSAGADEIHFARLTTDHVGANLHEFDVVSRSTFRLNGRSNRQVFLPKLTFLEDELYLKIGALTDTYAPLLTGFGGDHLFCIPTRMPDELDDSLQFFGFSDWWKRVLALSRHRGHPIWTLVSHTARARVAGGRRVSNAVLGMRSDKKKVAWLAADLHNVQRYIDEMQALETHGLPAGKVANVLALSDNRELMAPFHQPDLGYYEVHPIFSQPIVEYVLRTPTTELLGIRHDRLLARRMLTKTLPEEVAWRQSKGEYSNRYVGLLRLNAETLRPLIADGYSQAAGIIEPDDALAALERAKTGFAGDSLSLLRLVAIELWCRAWVQK